MSLPSGLDVASSAFNMLYQEEPDDTFPTREPPSEQLSVAQPEGRANSIEQHQTASADPPLAPDTDDILTVTDLEQTRSDERTEQQVAGQRRSRETGGGAVGPKKLYDENGALYWSGPDGPESDALPGGGTQKVLTSLASGTATAAVEAVKPVAAGLKDAVGNPLADVAEGVSSSMAGVSEGLVKQMNTMFIILGLAYVAGAAVKG